MHAIISPQQENGGILSRMRLWNRYITVKVGVVSSLARQQRNAAWFSRHSSHASTINSTPDTHFASWHAFLCCHSRCFLVLKRIRLIKMPKDRQEQGALNNQSLRYNYRPHHCYTNVVSFLFATIQFTTCYIVQLGDNYRIFFMHDNENDHDNEWQ